MDLFFLHFGEAQLSGEVLWNFFPQWQFISSEKKPWTSKSSFLLLSGVLVRAWLTWSFFIMGFLRTVESNLLKDLLESLAFFQTSPPHYTPRTASTSAPALFHWGVVLCRSPCQHPALPSNSGEKSEWSKEKEWGRMLFREGTWDTILSWVTLALLDEDVKDTERTRRGVALRVSLWVKFQREEH